MSAHFCIGSRDYVTLVELPLVAVEVLLDFVIDREEQDDQDYRTKLEPLRFAVTEGPGDPDQLDVWSSAKGWQLKVVASALELCVVLLDRHGEMWRRDPDWLPAGLEPAVLKRQLEVALDCIRRSEVPELLTWIRR